MAGSREICRGRVRGSFRRRRPTTCRRGFSWRRTGSMAASPAPSDPPYSGLSDQRVVVHDEAARAGGAAVAGAVLDLDEEVVLAVADLRCIQVEVEAGGR